MTGDSEAPEVFEEDREAAREAFRNARPEASISPARLEKLAGQHAHLGDSLFRLRYLMRPARTPAERTATGLWLGLISQQEFDARLAVDQQRPLDPSDFEVTDQDVDDALRRYSKLQLALTDLMHRRPDCSQNAPEYLHLRYQFRELQHFWTLGNDRRKLLVRRIEEIRVSHRMGRAQAKEFSCASALELVRDVTSRFRIGWNEIHRIHAERIREQRPCSYFPADLFYREMFPLFPTADDLKAHWRAEFAAVRLEFPPGPSVDQTAVPPSVSSASEEPARATEFTSSDFANWALGLRADSKWVLFRKVSGQWRQDQVLKLSKGNGTLLLDVLLQQRGTVDRSLFNERLRTQAAYRGESSEKLGRVITDGLTDVKIVIRQAIADSLKLPRPVAGNPFPNDRTGWMSDMPLGIVEKGEDGRDVLTIQSYNVA